MIKVCNVDEEGRFGGPEKRIVQVAKLLKDMGIHTHIVHPKFQSEVFVEYIEKNNICATQMDITRLSKEPKILYRYILRFIWELFLLIDYFQKNDFDLIHVNGSYQFKVALAGRLANNLVIWHLNDTMTIRAIKLFFPALARFCASGFIVSGMRVREYYLNKSFLAELPCEEIHAPVDTDIFYPDPSRICVGYDQTRSNSQIKIVTVSGINPTKGLEYFVKMAIDLFAINSNVRFFVAGAELTSQKKYYSMIKAIIGKSGIPDGIINFLGLVEDVPGLLKTADICVFTSISEASPTSIWEAMSTGLPVVTTDVGSVNQYISDGSSGFVVPVKDVNQLVHKVQSLIDSPELRAKFGKNARSVALEHLNVNAAARKHAKIYRRVLRLKNISESSQ